MTSPRQRKKRAHFKHIRTVREAAEKEVSKKVAKKAPEPAPAPEAKKAPIPLTGRRRRAERNFRCRPRDCVATEHGY